VNGRVEPSGAESRQRWRVVVRRGEAARDMTHREVEDAWADGLASAGVPVAPTGGSRPRPRLVFGAPVPVGVTADREPLDLYLRERLTIADLRERLVRALPRGHTLVDLHDVWLGSPSIASLVVSGDYRCLLADDAGLVGAAAAELLGATRLTRAARKGDTSKPYDLRPLILAMSVAPAEGSAAVADGSEGGGRGARAILGMRLRLASEAGTGRPDEVVDELGRAAGRPLIVLTTVRERLVLAQEG
jgi:radical SAM-linked protein